ncbi:suppressor of tub2 mutation, partial [Ceratobasidium sp. 428]
QLDATARKQLDKANPNPGACTPVTPVEETKKKPSVAAAIAASRAKAKAIATAPPTLRHAVTSPPARRAVSPPPPKTPTQPVRQPTSPRVPSTGARSPSRPPSRPPSRSAGSPGAPSPTTTVPPVPPLPRPASRGSTPSPPSPTSSSSTHRRQVSSSSVALPASPGRPSTLRSSYSQIRPGAKSGALANGGTTRTVPATVPPVPRIKSPILSKSTSSVPQVPSSPTRRATSPTTPTRRMPSSTGSPVSRKPLPANLPSLDQMIDNSESLLHAATIPIPDDDDDESMNLISFSTPYEKYPPTPPSTVSSSNIVGDMHEPDESLIAKAIQATSAASQLEDEVALEKDHPSPYPPELLAKRQDQTPMNRKIMREAALWQDSPQATKTPTILDHLFDQMHENGSWVHRRTVSLRQASVDLDVDSTAASADLRRNIDALSQGTADETVLRHLAVICSENGHSSATESVSKGQGSPELAPSSPTRTNGGGLGRPFTIQTDIWLGGKTFDKL